MHDQAKLHWNDPTFLEAIRLINKFFPESKGFVSLEAGISIFELIASMRLCDLFIDDSCDLAGPLSSDLGLAAKGGLCGRPHIVFARLLEISGYAPTARVVVVPDAFAKGWSLEKRKPFVCSSLRLGERLTELECLFDGGHDSIFVFESGECLAVDHDDRFYWAKSKQGNQTR